MTIQMINSIVEWERRISFENERREFHQNELYGIYQAADETPHEEGKSVFTRFLHRKEAAKSTLASRKEKSCKDPQPC